MFISACLFISTHLISVVCMICAVITWCKFPKFRTLQNYVSINQTVSSTMQLMIANLSNMLPFLNCYSIFCFEVLIFINAICFYSMLCWSFCGSLEAYWKLVLLRNSKEKMSYGKIRATFFVYTTITTIMVINLIVRKCIYLRFPISASTNLIPAYYIMTINLLLFIKIFVSVMSCCKKRFSKRRGKNVISLIGVGLMCDSELIFHVTLLVTSRSDLWITVGQICFVQRIILQLLFLLLKKSTRDLWRKHFERRRRIANNMLLQ